VMWCTVLDAIAGKHTRCKHERGVQCVQELREATETLTEAFNDMVGLAFVLRRIVLVTVPNKKRCFSLSVSLLLAGR
jgi:hypothetical protein